MKLIYATLLLVTLLGCTEKNNQPSTNFETKVEALAIFTDTSTADPDFGDPITTSTTRIFTFKNTGDTPGAASPNFTGSNPTDFSIILQTGCAMVNPGSTCTVRVNFNPSGKTTGRYSADLNIGNSIFKSLQTRVDTSSGTTGGGTSTIEASVSSAVIPNPLDYGSFSGTQSSTKIIRLKNTGTTSTGPHTAALSDTDFTFTLNGCNNKTLAPNAYCDVRVTFSASSKTAQEYLTDLTFAGSTFPLKATVTASGGTTTSGSGTPSIAILEGTNPATDPLNYGSFSGTQSLTKILTVKNTGTSSVVVNPVLSEPSFKFLLNSCANKTLTPNGTCSVRVTFSAVGQTAGTKASTLTVHPSKSLALTASVSGSSNQITVTFDVPPDTLMVTNEIYPPSLPNYVECGNYGASTNRQCQLTFTQGTDINIELQYLHDSVEPVAWVGCPQVESGGPGQWFCQLSSATSNFTLGMQVNPVSITYQPVFDSWSSCDAQVCQGQGNQSRNLIDCEKIVNGQNQGSAPIFQCMQNLNPEELQQSCNSPSGDVIVAITGGEQTFHCDEGSSSQNFVSVTCNQGYSSQGEECAISSFTAGFTLINDFNRPGQGSVTNECGFTIDSTSGPKDIALRDDIVTAISTGDFDQSIQITSPSACSFKGSNVVSSINEQPFGSGVICFSSSRNVGFVLTMDEYFLNQGCLSIVNSFEYQTRSIRSINMGTPSYLSANPYKLTGLGDNVFYLQRIGSSKFLAKTYIPNNDTDAKITTQINDNLAVETFEEFEGDIYIKTQDSPYLLYKYSPSTASLVQVVPSQCTDSSCVIVAIKKIGNNLLIEANQGSTGVYNLYKVVSGSLINLFQSNHSILISSNGDAEVLGNNLFFQDTGTGTPYNLKIVSLDGGTPTHLPFNSSTNYSIHRMDEVQGKLYVFTGSPNREAVRVTNSGVATAIHTFSSDTLVIRTIKGNDGMYLMTSKTGGYDLYYLNAQTDTVNLIYPNFPPTCSAVGDYQFVNPLNENLIFDCPYFPTSVFSIKSISKTGDLITLIPEHSLYINDSSPFGEYRYNEKLYTVYRNKVFFTAFGRNQIGTELFTVDSQNNVSMITEMCTGSYQSSASPYTSMLVFKDNLFLGADSCQGETGAGGDGQSYELYKYYEP